MLKIALAAAVLLTAPAAAWDRHTETTGPNGKTVTTNASGACANGTCNRDVVKTGPNGGVYDKGITTTRVEPGTFTRDVAGTGPQGRTFNRGGTFTRR